MPHTEHNGCGLPLKFCYLGGPTVGFPMIRFICRKKMKIGHQLLTPSYPYTQPQANFFALPRTAFFAQALKEDRSLSTRREREMTCCSIRNPHPSRDLSFPQIRRKSTISSNSRMGRKSSKRHYTCVSSQEWRNLLDPHKGCWDRKWESGKPVPRDQKKRGAEDHPPHIV